MCPRMVWGKIRPGDLVWPMLKIGVKLYKTNDAGETNNTKDIICEVPYQTACLMLAFAQHGDGVPDRGVILVLGPSGRYGWTHRLFWEKAGEEKQEWEVLGDEPG